MRKKICSIFICILIVLTAGILVEAKSVLSEENVMKSTQFINLTISTGYIDISVEEAWNLLMTTSNGIQIPIDVRSDIEWTSGHIDTPYPENSQHWSNLQNGEKMTDFLNFYAGKEIIVYCKSGGRSTTAANLLVANNFNGVIYNMLGGYDAWKNAGFPTTTTDYINITVEQAYNLLTNTSNGIQIPIDVRTNSEWATAHIDTPYPENPHHWAYLQDGVNLTEFMDFYQEREIILYCQAGSRSKNAAFLLDANNYTGTIYNMLGGFEAWKTAGYPTKPNIPPNTPVITGDIKGKVGEEYSYSFITTDVDSDDVYYYVNWSDNTTNQLIGPYLSGEEATVNHTWYEQGTYTVKVKARDPYGAESDYATLEIQMPCPYKPTLQFLEWLLERFPHAFPLLRQSMGY